MLSCSEVEDDENHLKKSSAWSHLCCIVCGIIAAIFHSVVFVIIIVLFVKILPNILQHQVQFDVLGSSTIPLDKNIATRWIKSVDLQWNLSSDKVHCRGEVAVIAGTNCLDLHDFLVNTGEEVTRDNINDYNLPFYALPGSRLTVSIPDSDDVKNKLVWFTRTLDKYAAFDDSRPHCENNPVPECEDACYKTDDYINSSIVFNVSDPGYYYYFLSSIDNTCYIRPLTSGIRYFVNIITFNYTTILDYYQHHSIHPVIINENRQPEAIRVSTSFKFDDEPSCPLLYVKCFDYKSPYYSLQLTGWKPRTDYVFVALICYVVCLLSDIFFVLLWFCIKRYMDGVQKHLYINLV